MSVAYVSQSDYEILERTGDLSSVTVVSFDDREDVFQQYLDDSYGIVSIGNETFSAGQVLRHCSPATFRMNCAAFFEEIETDDYAVGEE